MRRAAKHFLEAALCRSGITRLARSAHRGRTLVLAYHNIVPEGEPTVGDRSLHLPQREFARQLDLLQRTHDVVPLPAILRPTHRAGRPRAVITFDDAYRGAVTAGIGEVARRGMPATIFVAPAFLDGGSFWWDALAGPDGLPESVRQHGLEALQGKDGEIRRWASARGLGAEPLPGHQLAASISELEDAVRNPGVTLGSHTWGHVNLARVHGAELEEELARPLAWLQERFQSVVPWISYPYGLSSAEVERATERAGYQGGLRVDGGWLPDGTRQPSPWELPRFNVASGLSIRGFELRVSGLLGG